MLFSILLVTFLLIVILILLMPVIMVVDTDNRYFFVKIPGLAKASLVEDEKELLKIRCSILFFTFNFFPLRPKKHTEKKKATSKKQKKSKTYFGVKKGIRMLRSFKIKKFLVDIDTGNYVSNAQLYPFFYFLKFTNRGDFNINFEGRNRMELYMYNRPIYLIKSFINI